MIFYRAVVHSCFTLITIHGYVRTHIADLLVLPQSRTMSARLSRKRSRLAPDSDDDEAQQLRPPSPALSSLSDTLKRSKTQCELDELDIIEPKDAWTVDVGAILASTTLAAPSGSGLKPHNNWQRYQKDQSIIVLCVQGNLQLHYNLLWYVFEWSPALSHQIEVSPKIALLWTTSTPLHHRYKPSYSATILSHTSLLRLRPSRCP